MERLYWRSGLALALASALGIVFLDDAILDFVAAHLSSDGHISNGPVVLAKLAAALAVGWLLVPLAWLTWRPAALAQNWSAATSLQRAEVLAIGSLIVLWVVARVRWGAYVDPATPGWVAGWHREDGVLEAGTALLALIASIVLAGTAARLSGGGRVIAGALALGAFVFGMEEISWGQRIFGIEGPEALVTRNRQGETNFHNFFAPRIIHQVVPVVACTAAAVYFAFAHALARWLPRELRTITLPEHRLLLSIGFQLLAVHALVHRTAEVFEEAVAVLLLSSAVRLARTVRATVPHASESAAPRY